MGQRLKSWRLSSGVVEIHAASCRHNPASRRSTYVQDQLDHGEHVWNSMEEYGLDYWSDINAERKAECEFTGEEYKPYVFDDLDFKLCVTVPRFKDGKKK